MEEKKITSAAAAEETIASIKKLLEAVGNDDELNAKLEETLTVLTGKPEVPKQEATAEPDTVDNFEGVESQENNSEENVVPEEAQKDDGMVEDDDEEDDCTANSSRTDLSYVFNEDAIAGLIVVFAAGAAIVGGGVLLHTLLKQSE